MLFPTTYKGAVVLAAILASAFILLFTVTTGGAIIGLVAVATLAIALYYLGFRLDDYFKGR